MPCFFHAAFCSQLFFCVYIVFNCFHLLSYFYYSSICSLFLLFFPPMNHQSSFLMLWFGVYSGVLVYDFVCQAIYLIFLSIFLLSVFLQFIVHHCFVLWFSIRCLQSLLFSSILFADESKVICISILVTKMFFFVFYFLKYFNSHVSLYSYFRATLVIFRYFLACDTVDDLEK